MKPRVFLGSSAESISITQKVSDMLSDFGDCVKWTCAFVQNKSNLDSLVHQTQLSDFSVLIASKDDILLKKEELHVVARDNIIFEFGLFLGAGGINRCFILAEEGIDLPSDLDGITIAKFVTEAGNYNSLENRCNEIKQQMIAVEKTSSLGFLPSTALAIGYYYNFIRKVCEAIHSDNKIVIGEKENAKEIKLKEFKFHVIIPNNLDDNGIENFKILYYKKNNFNNGMTGTIATKRGYPFVFKLDPLEQDEEDKIIYLYDLPSTLNTIVEALKIFMPKVQVGESDEVEHLEKRELKNFAKVLKYLISKNVSTKDYVVVMENVELDK
jgi:hypothetical protein